MKKTRFSTLVALATVAFLLALAITNAQADSSSDAYVRVAVLNSVDIPPYAFGVNTNLYQNAVDALNKDPNILADIVTNAQVQAGILKGYDVFFLPDNWPANASNPMIYDFWNNSNGGIVALDSAIAFLCYVGILPAESIGSNGRNVYWGYQTQATAVISVAHPVTAGYTVGENITGQPGNARYNVTALSGTTGYPYYTMLANQYANTTWAYASAYAPPDKGRVVHIWDHRPTNLPTRLLLLNAVKWTAQAPTLAQLLGIDDLQTRIAALQSQVSALQAQLGTATANITNLRAQITSLESEISTLETQLDQVDVALTTQTSDLEDRLNTTTMIAAGGIIVGIIGIVIAAFAIMRGPKKPAT